MPSGIRCWEYKTNNLEEKVNKGTGSTALAKGFLTTKPNKHIFHLNELKGFYFNQFIIADQSCSYFVFIQSGTNHELENYKAMTPSMASMIVMILGTTSCDDWGYYVLSSCDDHCESPPNLLSICRGVL